jgi:hypothetical protein
VLWQGEIIIPESINRKTRKERRKKQNLSNRKIVTKGKNGKMGFRNYKVKEYKGKV